MNQILACTDVNLLGVRENEICNISKIFIESAKEVGLEILPSLTKDQALSQ